MARDPKADGEKVVALRPAHACPNCGKPSSRPTWPFCSKRCADIDLNRWLSGAYAIPGAEQPTEEDEQGA